MAYPAEMRFLFRFANTLRTSEGVIVDTNNRVFVPEATVETVLNELHAGHPGCLTMLTRAKSWFFWQHMTQDIRTYSEQCETCALYRPWQAVEPLLPRSMPNRPGETVAADFFQLRQKGYLVLYDVFSQFPVLWPVSTASTASLLKASRAAFQFTGCPRVFSCDQGGAFDSQEFRIFAQSIGMKIEYSLAEYPQSNGGHDPEAEFLHVPCSAANPEQVEHGRVSTSSRSSRRVSRSPKRYGCVFTTDNIEPQRRRKKDYCRDCKTEECEHCYGFKGDSSTESNE
jgi:hypothetical protein